MRHHSLNVDSKILASVGMKDAIWIATESNEIKQVLLPNLEVVLTLSSTKLELNDYSEGAITKTKENALVFGGNRGFHYFHPELLTFDQFTDIPSQKPQLVSLKLFGKEQTLGQSDSILDKPINLKESLTLSMNDSRFSLGFAVLNAISPSTVKYRYRMNGLDKTWTQAGKERPAAPQGN